MSKQLTPVFAVGDVHTAVRLLQGRAVLVSHAYLGSRFVPLVGEGVTLWDLLKVASKAWCDSGAFTYWQRALKGKPGAGINVETWAQFITEHAAHFDHFVSLDEIADANASLRNWSRLLELVPPAHHGKLVPVWHEGDPAEHLDAYDPDARLVALGRTSGRQAGAAGRKATRAFYDAAFNAYPGGLFHFLGNGNPETIEPYPAHSFDVTTWQRDSTYAESHGWPWSAVSKDTRMRAYIEAFETITHKPRALSKQTGFAWAAQ